MKTTYLNAYKEFLARLKRARKETKITQQELAKRLRRPQSFVSKYENAERRLDVVEFLQVTYALGIDSSYFVKGLTNALGLQVHVRRNKLR